MAAQRAILDEKAYIRAPDAVHSKQFYLHESQTHVYPQRQSLISSELILDRIENHFVRFRQGYLSDRAPYRSHYDLKGTPRLIISLQKQYLLPVHKQGVLRCVQQLH